MPSNGTTPPGEVIVAEMSDRLVGEIRGYGPTLVAFSGGADSALVLAAAVRALGRGAVAAFTSASASVPVAELRAARAFAASLGVPHHVADTGEMEVEGYRANDSNRCFFCKGAVLDVACRLAGDQGFRAVATGTNADDLGDRFRPGIVAGRQRGVRTPLADAGLSKGEVRALSRHWGLSTWNKPAMPCLASRIAYGVRVTPYRLARVERAELAIRAMFVRLGLAVRDLRVRDLGQAVRVEVDERFVLTVRKLSDFSGVLAEAGFSRDVAVSVEPFRSGSLNATADAPRVA